MGAAEGNRRAGALRRKLADQGRNVARLSLEDETARHLEHMPDAPEAPVAAVVDAGMIDRLAARAKARVKASPRGWSLLSQVEIIALTWAVDLFLEDGEMPPPPPAHPEPTVISHV